MPDEPVTRRPPPPRAPEHGPEAAAVAQTYDLGEVRAPLHFAARGELGRMWRLDTDTGSWAVKELLWDMTETAAADDVAFQQHALANGVRMPRPRVTRDGRVLAAVPGTDGRARSVRTYSWLDLEPEPPSAPAVRAAEQLGRLHSRPFPDDGPPDPWFSAPVADDRWPEILAAGEASAATWAPALSDVIPELVRATRVVVAGGALGDRVRCHLDYNPMNVLLDRAGRTVVVDWENCGPATLDEELASAIAEFVPDADDLPAFLEAYLAAGGRRTPLTLASFALTLAVQAHLVEFYTRRSLDRSESEENRVRGAFWAQDICEQLFTVDQVEAWVAAARPYLG